MPITVKDIQDMFNKDVFTNKGFYCGRVNDMEFDLSRFKIRALVISADKNSVIGKMVGGKKGVIVPYPMVQAVGDVVIIKHISGTSLPEETSEETG
jgi:sporulation protein YlmC with PRC-barrel domain